MLTYLRAQMNVTSLLYEMKSHARIDTDLEDAGLLLMLTAAAGDIGHAAGYTMPADAADLPNDLRFAIIDQATGVYDDRGMTDGTRGLTLQASRIAARYKGVSLGTA